MDALSLTTEGDARAGDDSDSAAPMAADTTAGGTGRRMDMQQTSCLVGAADGLALDPNYLYLAVTTLLQGVAVLSC